MEFIKIETITHNNKTYSLNWEKPLYIIGFNKKTNQTKKYRRNTESYEKVQKLERIIYADELYSSYPSRWQRNKND